MVVIAMTFASSLRFGAPVRIEARFPRETHHCERTVMEPCGLALAKKACLRPHLKVHAILLTMGKNPSRRRVHCQHVFPSGPSGQGTCIGRNMSWYSRAGPPDAAKSLCLVCLERSRGGKSGLHGRFRPATTQDAIALP